MNSDVQVEHETAQLEGFLEAQKQPEISRSLVKSRGDRKRWGLLVACGLSICVRGTSGLGMLLPARMAIFGWYLLKSLVSTSQNPINQ